MSAQDGKSMRCAVIGYGGAFNMGKYHGNLMNQTPGLQLVAACDIDPRRAEQAKEDFPGIKTFTKVDDLLAQPDVDLVTVITPHNTHAPLAVQVLNAGKHCIVEKPMCVGVQAADRMIEAARGNHKMLSVFHNRHWDGRAICLRETIKKGLIGDVFHLEITQGGYGHPGTWWRSNKEISGGALYDWGAHTLEWLLGAVESRVTSVRGFVQKRVWHDVTNEDHIDSIISFANGAVALVEQSSIAFASKPWLRVLGTNGALVDAGDGFTYITEKNGVRVEGKIRFPKDDQPQFYRNVAAHLLHGETLVITPEWARRVTAIIETTQQSARLGKELPVPHEDE